jgi:hypothetical protein
MPVGSRRQRGQLDNVVDITTHLWPPGVDDGVAGGIAAGVLAATMMLTVIARTSRSRLRWGPSGGAVRMPVAVPSAICVNSGVVADRRAA